MMHHFRIISKRHTNCSRIIPSIDAGGHYQLRSNSLTDLLQKSQSETLLRGFSSKQDDKGKTALESTASVWQQVQSPPNLITLTRMASTPLLAYWVISGQYTLAVGGCALAAASDYLDGYLAKHYGWSTVLGTYLDPLADKAFINTLGCSLWYVGILPTPLVMVWAAKDVMLLSGTAWYLYQKNQSISFISNSVGKEPLKVNPLMIAKANTALQFATLGIGVLVPVLPMPPVLLDTLCWVTGATTVGSVLSYASQSVFDTSSFSGKM